MEPKMSKRAVNLLKRLTDGCSLHCASDRTEEGIKKVVVSFWTEPDGKKVGPATAKELIASGILNAANDGLLPQASQSWRL